LITVPAGSPSATLDALLNLDRLSSCRRVLLPADDATMHLVSRHRDDLSRHYAFVLPPPNVVDLLLDKTEFHGWASERGFPVPETHVAESEGQLTAILRDVRYPVVLKPLVHTPGWEALSPNRKAYKLFGQEGLHAIGFSLFDAAPKFVVQRWIEGGDDCVHFCLTYVSAAGEEASSYTGRKLLQWPPQTGSTAICVGGANPALLDLTRAVWKAAGFRGLGSVEAKYSAEDHKYYITEPTVGRNNLQSYVAVAGGVNLTRLAVEDALGLPARATGRVREAVWINEPFAILALHQAFAQRKAERRGLRRLFTALRSIAFGYFAGTDPLPLLGLAWASFEALRRASVNALRIRTTTRPLKTRRA
jgi:predicted ATP-grasp superfamily ATP-dependent carboligase